MNIKLIFPAIALFLLTACTSTEEDPNVLNNPSKGILCDQYICADQKGVSIGLTEHYLGSEQAKAIMKGGKFDTSAMTFSNGVFCDTKVKLCYVDRYFDAGGERSAISQKYTEELFNKN